MRSYPRDEPKRELTPWSVRVLFMIGLVTGCIFSVGCYERNLAPEIQYSQDDVNALNNELDNFEWD